MLFFLPFLDLHCFFFSPLSFADSFQSFPNAGDDLFCGGGEAGSCLKSPLFPLEAAEATAECLVDEVMLLPFLERLRRELRLGSPEAAEERPRAGFWTAIIWPPLADKTWIKKWSDLQYVSFIIGLSFPYIRSSRCRCRRSRRC